MGCWNETDGVTQLPILSNDKCRCFILVKHGEVEGGGSCYSNDYWSPLGMPIRGRYNDYGNIEKITENQDTEILLNEIKEGWIINQEALEKVPSAEELDLEQALYNIERGYTNYSYLGRKTELGLFLVLEDVYQAMIKFNPIVAHYNFIDNEYLYRPYQEKMFDSCKQWYEEVQNKYLLFQKSFSDEKDPNAQAMLMVSLDMMSDRHSPFSDYRNVALKAHKKLLLKKSFDMINYSDESVQKLIKSCLEFTYFNSSMSSARKQWIPQTGKGSQDDETSIHINLTKAVTKIVKGRNQINKREGEGIANKKGYYSFMIDHNKQTMKKINAKNE